MDFATKIIILIVLFIIMYIYGYNRKKCYLENFASTDIMGMPVERQPLEPDFMDDPVFTDVKTYLNDIDNNNQIQNLGINKCLSQCDGKCVEFGVSGTAFCFPNKWNNTTQQIDDKYEIINKALTCKYNQYF